MIDGREHTPEAPTPAEYIAAARAAKVERIVAVLDASRPALMAQQLATGPQPMWSYVEEIADVRPCSPRTRALVVATILHRPDHRVGVNVNK